jgi:predicted dehydrogenase
MEKDNTESKKISRRKFLGNAALSTAGFTIVPRFVLGGSGYTAPSDKLNIAAVGIGGMGKANLSQVTSENIVALCDVDEVYAGPVFKSFPKAKKYVDYRKMLEEQKDIDAVIIATPDHTHAVITMAAMNLGKHVYVQKPLTYTVHESRELTKKALQNPKIVTCMGNQGHSSDDARLVNEWIWNGAIGNVDHVYVWTNRPVWPQGIERPKETPPVPGTLNWDLFVGPAPMVPYHPAYTPFSWRGWVDYGVGALGDMGAHLIDHVVWSLQLGAPVSVEATSTPFNLESYPLATHVTYEFAARNNMPPVKMTWMDGGIMPSKPEELGTEDMPKGGGVLYMGSKGKLLHETYGSNPRLLPQSNFENYSAPKKLERIGMSHEMDWVNHCKKGTQPLSNFEYAGPLNETMLLGVVALRDPGKKLQWDSDNMTFKNSPDASSNIKREYRKGWTLA